MGFEARTNFFSLFLSPNCPTNIFDQEPNFRRFSICCFFCSSFGIAYLASFSGCGERTNGTSNVKQAQIVLMRVVDTGV